MRKKLFTSSLGLVALIALVAAVVAVYSPEVTARPPCECCGSFLTAEAWGNGSTCGAATQDLYNQVFALAEGRCGNGNVCNAGLVITAACHGNPVMVDGKLTHGCCEGSEGAP